MASVVVDDASYDVIYRCNWLTIFVLVFKGKFLFPHESLSFSLFIKKTHSLLSYSYVSEVETFVH